MKPTGWIKIHRTLLNDVFWQDKPFSKGQAWIDLLLIVEIKPVTRVFNGAVFELNAGDVVTSIGTLSQRWGWSKKKVWVFIGEHLGGHRGVYRGSHKGIVISIINWNSWQAKGNTEGYTQETPIYKEEEERRKKGNFKQKKELEKKVAAFKAANGIK